MCVYIYNYIYKYTWTWKREYNDNHTLNTHHAACQAWSPWTVVWAGKLGNTGNGNPDHLRISWTAWSHHPYSGTRAVWCQGLLAVKPSVFPHALRSPIKNCKRLGLSADCDTVEHVQTFDTSCSQNPRCIACLSVTFSYLPTVKGRGHRSNKLKHAWHPVAEVQEEMMACKHTHACWLPNKTHCYLK